MSNTLCVIMPIYNEEASIEKTFNEWFNALNEQSFFSIVKFVLLNDGSKDKTLSIINEIAVKYPESVHVIDKKNTGHGHSCLVGYQFAVKEKYDFTMQLDSDGQCDPVFLPKFIEQLKKYNIVYGFRYIRKDGFLRFLISRVLAFVAFYRTGIWVWDPNCPYRIFKTESISTFVNSVDPTYILINVVLALEHKRMGMKLVNIVFRDRHGGSPSLNTASLVKVGSEFGRQLKHFKK